MYPKNNKKKKNNKKSLEKLRTVNVEFVDWLDLSKW